MAINLFGRGRVMDMGDESIDDDAEVLKIPIHAFDLIVADECHRGYTTAEEALWRETLDHFDAIKIGLTATPARHTAAYFTDVVYRYEYSRAVREGFLVDYDAGAIRSEARLKGVFLQAGDQVALVDPEKGSEQLDRLEDHREYDAADLERRVTSPESNRKILEEVHKYALDHEARRPLSWDPLRRQRPAYTSHATSRAARRRHRPRPGFRKDHGRVDRPPAHPRVPHRPSLWSSLWTLSPASTSRTWSSSSSSAR
jgi:type I restriction enzyme R subunit